MKNVLKRKSATLQFYKNTRVILNTFCSEHDEGSKDSLKRFLYIFLFILFSNLNGFTIEPASVFKKANELYMAKDYTNAALQYEQLIKQQYTLPEIYYNLGNCYYKTDNNARAVLNYERALKYKPDDEDILFNLKVTQLKLIDKIDVVPQIFYKRWLYDLYALFATDTWAIIISACVWLLFLSAALYILSNRIVLRKVGFILALIFFLLSLGTGFLGQQNYKLTHLNKSGIVISVSAYVKSSPGESNTDLFLLHEGTKLNVLDTYDNWIKISIANGSVGWLKKSDIEEI